MLHLDRNQSNHLYVWFFKSFFLSFTMGHASLSALTFLSKTDNTYAPVCDPHLQKVSLLDVNWKKLMHFKHMSSPFLYFDRVRCEPVFLHGIR